MDRPGGLWSGQAWMAVDSDTPSAITWEGSGTITEVGVLHPDYRESVAVKLVD